MYKRKGIKELHGPKKGQRRPNKIKQSNGETPTVYEPDLIEKIEKIVSVKRTKEERPQEKFKPYNEEKKVDNRPKIEKQQNYVQESKFCRENETFN